jgi:hypothetical protein
MLKLTPKPTFEADVKLTVPGQAEPGTITVTWKYMPKKALLDFFEAKKGADDAEALHELIAGWKGIDAEYNADNLKALLDNYPAAALELMTAYQKQVFESRVKN